MAIEGLRDMVLGELTSDDGNVRKLYLGQFRPDVDIFTELIVQAFDDFHVFSIESKGDGRKAYISAILYNAFILHIMSMKLLLSGYAIPAGNLYRQVIESIALALLCSAKELNILDRFIQDKYSTNNAVTDLSRHHHKLSLKEDAWKPLKQSQEFYHKFSHISKMSIVYSMSFSLKGKGYLGASFDLAKLDRYKQEVVDRINFAKILPGVVAAVKSNVAKW